MDVTVIISWQTRLGATLSPRSRNQIRQRAIRIFYDSTFNLSFELGKLIHVRFRSQSLCGSHSMTREPDHLNIFLHHIKSRFNDNDTRKPAVKFPSITLSPHPAYRLLVTIPMDLTTRADPLAHCTVLVAGDLITMMPRTVTKQKDLGKSSAARLLTEQGVFYSALSDT